MPSWSHSYQFAELIVLSPPPEVVHTFLRDLRIIKPDDAGTAGMLVEALGQGKFQTLLSLGGRFPQTTMYALENIERRNIPLPGVTMLRTEGKPGSENKLLEVTLRLVPFGRVYCMQMIAGWGITSDHRQLRPWDSIGELLAPLGAKPPQDVEALPFVGHEPLVTDVRTAVILRRSPPPIILIGQKLIGQG